MWRVEGGQGLARVLETMPARLSRNLQFQALYAGGAKIQDAASKFAPVDPKSRRHLRDHIIVRPSREESKAPTIAVGPERGTAFYGTFQEWGTQYHGKQPFMRPALDTAAQAAIGAVTSFMRQHFLRLGLVGSSRTSGGGLGEGLGIGQAPFSPVQTGPGGGGTL
jgi:HK97 gp10 family phage protein